MRPRCPQPLRTLGAVLVAGAAAVITGCGGSSREGESAPAPRFESEDAERRFTAEAASIGVWRDERSSGLVIRHGLLVLDGPDLAEGPRGGRSVIVVTTPSDELYRKVEDVLSDRIPVTVGMRTQFAIGKTVPVRIERVEPDGRRSPITEGQVAFLEIVRR
jgi:hypothetical protein